MLGRCVWLTAILILYGCGCSRGRPEKTYLTSELKATMRNLIVSADSIVAFDVESDLPYGSSEDSIRVVGARALDPRLPRNGTVGLYPRSPGHTLTAEDRQR